MSKHSYRTDTGTAWEELPVTIGNLVVSVDAEARTVGSLGVVDHHARLTPYGVTGRDVMGEREVFVHLERASVEIPSTGRVVTVDAERYPSLWAAIASACEQDLEDAE